MNITNESLKQEKINNPLMLQFAVEGAIGDIIYSKTMPPEEVPNHVHIRTNSTNFVEWFKKVLEEKMGTTKQVYPLIENEKEETKENKENQNSLDSPL